MNLTQTLIDQLMESAPYERNPTQRRLAKRHDVAWLETGFTGSQLTERQREMKRQFYERQQRRSDGA